MEENIFNIETEIDEKEKAPEKKLKNSTKEEIIEWAKSLFWYCVLPLTIFWIFCFMTTVPTGSMNPTIPVGAQVFTTRVFNKDNVKRGDIIVFECDELDKILIKRCIGLPGDNLVFDGSGSLYINGELYYEPYVSSFSAFKGEFNVPEDCYFFCGDNRGGSSDARYFRDPYIHKDKVISKGRFIIFPFSSFGVLE